ncbi:MAG: fibronectin type III domain-containing protein [Clostridia bacterium]|nr:fibronectin type III domain-containing protein [Clostridia bacterium]
MKRVIAFVLVCVMLLTIAPFAFAEGEHPTASQIQITDSLGENHWLSTSKPYYKNDAENPTSEAAGANVAYNETTGVLTLNYFNGGTIRSNGGKGDLSIVAKGVNTIQGGQFGIYAQYCNITVTSEEQAVINISTYSNNSSVGAIVSCWQFYNNNTITIRGKVTLNSTSTSEYSGEYGLRAGTEDGGKIRILDQASVNINHHSQTQYSSISGFSAAALEVNTTGSVNIDLGDLEAYCYALNVNAADIQNVKEFNIKAYGYGTSCIAYDENVYNYLLALPGFAVERTSDTVNHIEYLRLSNHVHHYTPSSVVPAQAAAVGYTVYACACGANYTVYTAPTGKVSGFKCAARTAAAEKLTWNKMAGVTGYQIQISNAAGTAWGKAYATTANYYLFKSLTAGSNYKFRMRTFINAPDGKNYFGPWVAIASPTLPVNTTLKVTAGSKAFTAQWGKKAVTGYQLQYSTKANFAGAATITVKNAKTYKYAVKNLKAKTVYYVRVRTYKTIAKVNYFSAWSATAKVKTK